MKSLSREMWESVERYHQLCYWAPEVREEATDAGLKGFFMNYFATRVAPLGSVSPELVESLFFYYAPQRIRRAIPDAWNYSTPEAILDARYRGMDQALRRELGELIPGPEVTSAAQIVREAVEAIDGTGRTLFAGWNSLPWPDSPHLALWHGCTVLREHRSGCHLIALAVEGLDGCQSVITQVAVDEAPTQWIQDEAGWASEAVEQASSELRRKGWLDDDDNATLECHQGRQRIEELTDRLDAEHWVNLDVGRCEQLRHALATLNGHLPKDDQLDWRDIYSADETRN